MSLASAIYEQIEGANNNINGHRDKITDFKNKKTKLKKARGIIKDNKSEISDEKRNAHKKLSDFKNWKGSNYDNYEELVAGDLIEGYRAYSSDLDDIIDEISDAISRLDHKISDHNDVIDQIRNLISALYDDLANLVEEEEE
ncbi:MAG: DUF5082 family protein [Lachnotalea sp.]